MSIATELSRIQTDRNTIRNKLIELGLAKITDNLDALAAAIEGIVKQGAVAIEVKEGETYTIPAGYHSGTGTVAGVAGGGNYTLQQKSVTPTKAKQSVVSDEGYYGLSGVEVAPIPDAYHDVTSVTAGEGDVLTGKIYVNSKGVVTAGKMLNNGEVHITLDTTNDAYHIPEGYHNGKGNVSIQLDYKTVTPTKSRQTVNPSDQHVLSQVTVEPIPDNYIDTSDADAEASHILAGKKAYIDGELVTGTMKNNGAVQITLDTSQDAYNIPAGYHDGMGAVSLQVEVKTITPTKSKQLIYPSDGFVLSQVTVEAIPDNFIDTSAADAAAGHILSGKKAYVDGVLVTGTMANNGSISKTIDGLSTVSASIPAGYTTGGTVSLTSDIEEALAAI